MNVSPRFERPASGTEEILGPERELAVGVPVTARWPTRRSVFGAARCASAAMRASPMQPVFDMLSIAPTPFRRIRRICPRPRCCY